MINGWHELVMLYQTRKLTAHQKLTYPSHSIIAFKCILPDLANVSTFSADVKFLRQTGSQCLSWWDKTRS